MKKILLAATVAALSSTSVFAADLAARPYTKAPPPVVAPIYNWTGFYIGAHLGGAFGSDNTMLNYTTLSASIPVHTHGGFLGGGQLGYNWQFSPSWVFGLEGDISALDYKRDAYDSAGNVLRQKTDWLASITGRLGYTWGPGMIYAKGGVAFRDDGGFSTSNPLYTVDNKSTGYTIGGGAEYMFSPAWSAKVEYQYYNFDKSHLYYSTAWVGDFKTEVHTVKVGINYHFNWGSPVVARY